MARLSAPRKLQSVKQGFVEGPVFAIFAHVHSPHSPAIIDPELLLLAYRGGIFPMADSRDDPEVFWVEPRCRAILPLGGLHCSHSLARTLRRGRFRVTCNAVFAEVMQACAGPRRDGTGESWISHRIEASYIRLHELGFAHSLECWLGDELAGGLYGVGFDRVFCGESMFSRATDASKIALAWLVVALRRAGARLLDCQFITPHLASLSQWRSARPATLRCCRQLRPGPPPLRVTPMARAMVRVKGKAKRRAWAPRWRCPQLSPRCWRMRRLQGPLPRRGTSSRSP